MGTYNVLILTLIASSFIFIINQNNNKYENLIENEKYNYESVKLQLNNREDEIINLHKEIESFNQIGLNVYKEIYINSLNYYRNKDYRNAISGFEYISKNKELDNYLKAESIYLTALCYENIGSYELAIDYYKLYMEEYPDGNYYDYSLYNIQKINTKHK